MKTKTKLGANNWTAIVLLAFSGQIAWVIENSWFNTFVNDVISPDPRVISLMVALSAITATLTTLIMGTLSDRLGKRKIIILISYILWGISTMVFPAAGAVKSAALAVAAVVALDSLMTFFGSTANDASFNAWLTNVTDETNRGTVSGITELFPLLAMVVTTIVSGMLIEYFGYTLFFTSMGLLVVVCGLVGGLLMKEAPVPKVEGERPGFWKQVFSGFSVRAVRENRMLFSLYFCVLVFAIAENICMPYQIIYFTKTLGYGYDVIGINLGLMVLLAGICGVFFGRLVDRLGKPKLLLAALFVSALGFLLVSLGTGHGVSLHRDLRDGVWHGGKADRHRRVDQRPHAARERGAVSGHPHDLLGAAADGDRSPSSGSGSSPSSVNPSWWTARRASCPRI